MWRSTLAPRAIAASASSSSCRPAIRSIHSSSIRLEKRQPDGTWVSDNTRMIERTNHFEPKPLEPLPKKGERELFPDKRPHDKISPRVNPVQGTHTILKQRKDIRMQFQLEPVTRTKVKGDAAAGNLTIPDYTRAEVYTRAPWPAYREIVLNQPQHLHVLSRAVIQQLNHFTQSIEQNRDITATMMISRHINTANRPKNYSPGVDKETGRERIPYEKTFCGGMDMHTLVALARAQAKMPLVDGRQSGLSQYFRSLYSLAWQIHRMRSPLVIAMDGLAVGAGAGFALQSRYRLATENTRISFPQAALGWFPDAGASYTLSRLDGKLGFFFALTGWQVRGLDAQRLGFCTHYCESDELHRFGRRIGDSSLTYQFAEDTIEQAFGMFSNSSPSFLPLPIHDLHEVINSIFTAESVEEVIVNMVARIDAFNAKVARVADQQKRFAEGEKVFREKVTPKEEAINAFVIEVQNRMLKSSPVGLKVTFELLKLAQFLPLESCLKLEFRLSQRLLSTLSQPLKAEIFAAPNFSVKSLGELTPKALEQIFEQDADEDKELDLKYPEKTEPVWYV